MTYEKRPDTSCLPPATVINRRRERRRAYTRECPWSNGRGVSSSSSSAWPACNGRLPPRRRDLRASKTSRFSRSLASGQAQSRKADSNILDVGAGGRPFGFRLDRSDFMVPVQTDFWLRIVYHLVENAKSPKIFILTRWIQFFFFVHSPTFVQFPKPSGLFILLFLMC